MIKLQIGCMIIILFIAALYFGTKRKKTFSHILFSVSLAAAMLNLTFDMITVYTVNHLDAVPEWINRSCHIVFFGSMIAEIFIFFLYGMILIYGEETAKRRSRFTTPAAVLAWLTLAALPLEYVQTPEGNYSWGPAVIAIYGILMFCMLFSLCEVIRHWRSMNPKKRFIVVLAYAIQLAVMLYQALFPTALISGAGIALVNLALFLTVESPDVLLIERLREEKERADEANEAKSQFLSNMSHEIRTPMNAIVGLTEVLLRGDWPAQERRYLCNIKNSGDALLSLINDLLDFSKAEAGKFVISEEDYEPLAMIEDLKVIFQNRAGDKKLALKYDIDPKLPKVLCGDGMRIRQIIINLMNNAIKFTESGYVKLSVQVRHRRQDGVELCVSVQDSGQGIRQEDLERLFDAFTQVDIKKNLGKAGTGLGLAICKQLVELMGGTIHVKSEYGKGSDFYFILWQKAVSRKTVGDVQKEQKDGLSPERKERQVWFDFSAPDAKVLLVDDNELNQEIATALLEPLQMRIDVAGNGMEAFQMIQQKEYDLVFMDHYMPVMDGVEAVMKIRELPGDYYRQVPILALTADAVQGEREKFIAAGMDDVVTKPIQIREICEKIRYYLPEGMVIVTQ